jgi:ureidoglycolate hydrolase
MSEFVEVHEHLANDFKPLVRFGSWRVAILNFTETVSREGFHQMERHMETDEVFVLLSGTAFLLVGGKGASVGEIRTMKLESRKLYNVRRNVWHHVVMSEDCSILIVENEDTAVENSEYSEMEPDQIARLRREIRV